MGLLDDQKERCPACLGEHQTTIGDLYRDNPIVHACLTLHFRGKLSYEEALIQAVIHLALNEEEAKRRLTEALNSTPASSILNMRGKKGL
jgi:hypothetical protein